MYSEPLYMPRQHGAIEHIECQRCGHVTRLTITYFDGDCDVGEIGNCWCCGASLDDGGDDESGNPLRPQQ
ncbi:hypothetical protein DZA65_03218 [Dickeya dianthicola]|nr:hypothetical protein DZA65_03218 [Dickeya dianthicola]